MTDSEVASEDYVHYLTQWKIVGNSEVHGVGNLTSWKVSGNSIVQDNVIMSCGDYSDVDGKYHVKISNGVTIYDIPLTEPLRKVNDVADTIEFPSGTEGKALVTRNLALYSTTKLVVKNMDSQNKLCLTKGSFIGAYYDQNEDGNILCNKIEKGLSLENARVYNGVCFAMQYANIWIRNGAIEQTVEAYQSYFDSLGAIKAVYQLATPTTELVDVSPFPVSATDTYTSANVAPYSAFEHTENKEIWSCGEYNATDGKYHILVQPLGGSIADIALNEPLRKVNDVADTIEFPSDTEGKALVTRLLKSVDLGDLDWIHRVEAKSGIFAVELLDRVYKYDTQILISQPYNFIGVFESIQVFKSIAKNMDAALFYNSYPRYSSYRFLYICNDNYENANDFKLSVTGAHIIYELVTPTTELVDAPQIEEADSYSMVISQGGKAVEWSSFETE